jgi:hypothetical protein
MVWQGSIRRIERTTDRRFPQPWRADKIPAAMLSATLVFRAPRLSGDNLEARWNVGSPAAFSSWPRVVAAVLVFISRSFGAGRASSSDRLVFGLRFTAPETNTLWR